MLHRKPIIKVAGAALMVASAACSESTVSPPAMPSAQAAVVEAEGVTKSITRIAFSSDSAARPAIFTMNPDGSDVRKLTAFDFSSFPAQSPDGRKIAFVRDPVGALPQIVIMNASGRGAHAIAVGSHPKWHENGKIILFTGPFRIEDQRLFRMNLDGTELAPVPNVSQVQSGGTWVDALTVAVASAQGGSQELWLANIFGNTTPQKLTDCAAEGLSCGAPAASPIRADRRIVFVAAGPTTRELRMLDRRTGIITTILSDPLLVTDPATWSPDTTTVVFTSRRAGGTPQLFAIKADGSGQPVQLTSTATASRAAAWQR